MKINKKIAVSFVTIAGVLTGVVGITLAQFSDTATLSSNKLDTGNANLQISLDSPACSTGFTGSITGVQSSDLAPGQMGTKNFCLKNNNAGNFSLDVTASAVTTGTPTLDLSLITVTVDCGGGVIPVLLNGTQSGLIRTIVNSGDTVNCQIKQVFSNTATNGAQNKSVHYTVTFTGTQP